MVVACLQLSNHIVLSRRFPLSSPSTNCCRTRITLDDRIVAECSKETSGWRTGLGTRGSRCPIGDYDNMAVRLEVGIGPRFEVKAILPALR
jgi:hypothetical protein